MSQENEFPLNEKGQKLAEGLVSMRTVSTGGAYNVLLRDPSKEMGWHPTFGTQVAQLVAGRTGSTVEYVDCPRTDEEAASFVEELKPILEQGGVIHLDLGELSQEHEDAIARLIEGIHAGASEARPVTLIAETSSMDLGHTRISRRFHLVRVLETERPEPELPAFPV